MGQISTFRLRKGFRVGNYELLKTLARGWTAEAFLVREVMTDARRVLKIYENSSKKIREQRDFAHFAWTLEEHSKGGIGLLPLYYHMGHVFLPSRKSDKLGDNSYVLGNYFIVQEFIPGRHFTKESRCTQATLNQFLRKIKLTHTNVGHALGDLKGNVKIHKGTLRLVDCKYGSDEKVNKDFENDKDEVRTLFRGKGLKIPDYSEW